MLEETILEEEIIDAKESKERMLEETILEEEIIDAEEAKERMLEAEMLEAAEARERMLDEVESAQTPAAPGTDMVDEAIHVATGAGLFGSAGFLGAGALGARILTAVEGVADARLLTAVGGAADARLLQAAPPRRLTIIGSLWSFFFPTAGLSQAAVLMIAQFINFFVATKGVLDDSEGDRTKFWTAWLSGECLIYF